MFYKKINNFEIKAFFDEVNNELINEVKFNKKILKTKVLNDKISKRYMGLELIKVDLKNILNWTGILKKIILNNENTQEEKCILNSLFVSIITTYWKCFANATGRDGAKLSHNIISQEHIKIHNELQRMRNNFTAHSGNDPFESGYLLKVEDSENQFSSFILPVHRKMAYCDDVFANNIMALTRFLISYIETKQEELILKINAPLI